MSTKPDRYSPPHTTENDNDDREPEIDFFRLFNFSSDRNVGVDVGASLRNIRQPLQGAASAVMGGILSAVDSAIAILNEDFDNPSESITSATSTAYGDDDDDRLNVERSCDLNGSMEESKSICTSGKKGVMLCCRQLSRAKLSSESTRCATDSADGNSSKCEIVSCGDLAMESTQDISNSDSQHSTTSSPWLREEASDYSETDRKEDTALSEQDSIFAISASGHDSIRTVSASEKEIENETKMKQDKNKHGGCDKTCEERSKLDETTYCIVEREKETKDGWLVVDEK